MPIVMHAFVLWILCLGYAVGTDVRLFRRDGASKHASLVENADKSAEINKFRHETGDKENRQPRDKRTPQPQPKPQILLRNLPDSLITKRQFLPIIPELQNHDFGARREFEPTLLPTPRIIRPLEMERPLERGIIERGPIDLEHRPFYGQGMLSPQLIPQTRRQFVPIDGQLQPELAHPRHVFLEPHAQGIPLERLHRPLLQDRLQPELEPRLDAGESLHYGSLGDTPLLDMPTHHLGHLPEGYMTPRLLGNIEPHIHHHFALPPLADGLTTPRMQESLGDDQPRHYYPLHHYQEHLEAPVAHHYQERPQPEVRHHLTDIDQADPSVAPVDDNGEGDDSIENMMNELSRHKKKKAWVTDVNIYDKKNKDDDISKFLDQDDTFDDLSKLLCVYWHPVLPLKLFS